LSRITGAEPALRATGLQRIGSCRCQPINQRRHHVVRQMIQKLCHRVDPLFTGRTSRHDNASSALRDRWRLVYEVRKIVALNFFLDCSKQNGFLHGRTPSSMCRGRERNDSIHLDPSVQNPVDTGIRHRSISRSKFRGFLVLFVPIAVIPSGGLVTGDGSAPVAASTRNFPDALFRNESEEGHSPGCR
jgi:hypothetical protein